MDWAATSALVLSTEEARRGLEELLRCNTALPPPAGRASPHGQRTMHGLRTMGPGGRSWNVWGWVRRRTAGPTAKSKRPWRATKLTFCCGPPRPSCDYDASGGTLS